MADPIRLVILLSGYGSNCQAIIDAIAAGECHARIAAVISDKTDAFGLQRAQKAGIATVTVLRQDYDSRAGYDHALADIVAEYNPELIVLSGFMQIFSAAFVDRFKQQIINIHPSLLPKFPGLDTYTRALAAGQNQHGTSVHFVTQDLDAGPLIAQRSCPILPDDTVESLKQRTQKLEHQLYPQVIDRLAAERG